MPLTHSQIDIVQTTSTEKPSDSYTAPLKQTRSIHKKKRDEAALFDQTTATSHSPQDSSFRIRTKLGDHLHGYTRVGKAPVVEQVLHGHVSGQVTEQRDAVLRA